MKIIDNVYVYKPFEDDGDGTVRHIEIEEGKIKSIKEGRTSESGDHVYDAGGRFLSASFTDSHLHLLRYGLMKKEIDLRGIKSWGKMKEVVRNEYNKEKMEEGDWVIGRGLEDDSFEDIDRLLTAKDLEELDYEHPMFFLHDDGHECVLNEEALKIVKENDDLEKNHDIFIEKDEDGNWTGRFKDTAVHFIKFHFRQKNEQEVYEAVKDAVPHLLENGITGVHTDDLNFVGDYERLWNTYLDLEKNGDLKIKAYLHHYIYDKSDLEDFVKNDTKRSGDGTAHVKTGAIKIFLDGTQRLHTSALREPYHDKPETNGVLVYPEETLKDIVRTADENNMQVTMHAIGDRSIEAALDAIDQVGSDKMRHRIIHLQVMAPDLFEKLKRVKPYVETQPGFMMGEYDQTADWVGKEQERYCNAWKTLNDSGIKYTGSSDAPIGPLSPFMQIFAAVNRTDEDGNPEGGWIPEEKLSVDEIYNAYTATPAHLEFAENRKGKIEPGYDADFILLDEHPKKIAPEKLKDIKVQETWIDGEQVFKRDK